jgi:hypothetical protein
MYDSGFNYPDPHNNHPASGFGPGSGSSGSNNSGVRRRRLQARNGRRLASGDNQMPSAKFTGLISPVKYDDPEPIDCTKYEEVALSVTCNEDGHLPECVCPHKSINDVPLTYEEQPKPFCYSKNMPVDNCATDCGCERGTDVTDGVYTCINLDTQTYACDDPMALNYDSCASLPSEAERLYHCDYHYADAHLTPMNVPLFTNNTYNLTATSL